MQDFLFSFAAAPLCFLFIQGRETFSLHEMLYSLSVVVVVVLYCSGGACCCHGHTACCGGKSKLGQEWLITLRIFVDTANSGDSSGKRSLSESTPVSIQSACVCVCDAKVLTTFRKCLTSIIHYCLKRWFFFSFPVFIT